MAKVPVVGFVLPSGEVISREMIADKLTELGVPASDLSEKTDRVLQIGLEKGISAADVLSLADVALDG